MGSNSSDNVDALNGFEQCKIQQGRTVWHKVLALTSELSVSFHVTHFFEGHRRTRKVNSGVYIVLQLVYNNSHKLLLEMATLSFVLYLYYFYRPYCTVLHQSRRSSCILFLRLGRSIMPKASQNWRTGAQ